MINGKVEQVGGKEVKTKYGMKKTYSFKVGGVWYSTSFKNPNVSVGDEIGFDFTTDSYGNQVDATKITRSSTSTMGTPVPATTPPTARPATVYSGGGGKGVFPIPALDGQRSIVRQNALTNARELVVAMPQLYGMGDVVNAIIHIARRFESYTTGDMDMDEAKAEIAAEEKAKKA